MKTFSLPAFHKEYATDITEVIIKGRGFRLFTPKWIEPFIDPQDLMEDFPLWS